MAQVTQIIPKFAFPHVETVINDYTEVSPDVVVAEAPYVNYVFPFTSSQGIDNVFVRKRSVESFKQTYGDSNYKKYGQPLMMPLAVLQQDQTSVWCMRVMPENAAYSNNVISLYFKVDAADAYPDEPSKRKFRIKFSQKNLKDMTDAKTFEASWKQFDGESTVVNGEKVYKDAEGYTQVPILAIRSAGRGTYGDNYCVRISQNANYEKEYGIKMYTFDILTVNGGLLKIANYVGALYSSAKYNVATLINDVLKDAETGLAPVQIYADEDNTESVYDAYIAFCKEQNPLLKVEYETKYADYAIPESMMNGTEPVSDEHREHYLELKNIKAMIRATETDALIDVDEFDPMFGIKVASTEMLPFIKYVEELTDAVDTGAEDYDANDYTKTTNMPVFGSTKGVVMSKGSNGYFDNPRTVNDPVTGQKVQWTLQDEVDECYKNAFNGTYDRRILSPRRIPANALWDANYSYDVKAVIADLAALRQDAIFYLDTGIEHTSYSGLTLDALIEDYSVFDTRLVSKNLQHFTVKEPSTMKRVKVSITYFLAPMYAYHVLEYGYHVPFVKGNAELSGHVRDTLEPAIEDFESDLKEILYDNRFNYFETLDENVYQRGTQSTSQMAETDLTEENNTTTLYTLKRLIEKDIQARLYDFTDESSRAAFTAYEKARFADWIGTKVLSLDIKFTANAWESEHSIIHAYLEVVFRGLQKRAIVEIDINKRTYNSVDNTDEE